MAQIEMEETHAVGMRILCKYGCPPMDTPATGVTGVGAERFRLACQQAVQNHGAAGGIGTLGEKTLHAVLKCYIDPCADNHEMKIGPFIADIVGEDGIVEIQTRGFDKLRKKLEAFLEVATVTVVYPIAAVKWLSWVDPDTGETTPRRRSPKRRTAAYSLFELYKLKPLLSHPRLRLRLLLLELEEYRQLNGWSCDRKRGSTRCDRIPTALVGEVRIDCPADYAQLIPAGLPEQFTSSEFGAACGLSLSSAQRGLNVLLAVEAVGRVGKQGRFYIYRRGSG